MQIPSKRILAFIFTGFVGVTVSAQDLDTIGVTLLQAVTTNLNGAGIRVAQPEAYDNGTTNWEVNPTNIYGQQPASRFTYTSDLGSTTNFPNDINAESGHADAVEKLHILWEQLSAKFLIKIKLGRIYTG